MDRRKLAARHHRRRHPLVVPPPLPHAPYFCPTAGEVECAHCGGFDVCCDRPELHRPVNDETGWSPME